MLYLHLMSWSLTQRSNYKLNQINKRYSYLSHDINLYPDDRSQPSVVYTFIFLWTVAIRGKLWVELSDSCFSRTLSFIKCFDSHFYTEAFQSLSLCVIFVIFIVPAPVCTCQPYFQPIAVAAECRPQPMWNIDPIVMGFLWLGCASITTKASV